MSSRLRRNRKKLDEDLGGTRWRAIASPVLFALERALRSRIPRYVHGRVLDAGCGAAPYRALLEGAADRYDSLDIERRFHDQVYVADLQAMPEVPSSCYDAVLCVEVLEHVPEPAAALSEIARVLRPGGRLITTVPYLSRLHDEPHDYYRYTEHGLRYLLSRAGFSVRELEPVGHAFSFAGHQIATIVVAGTWGVPGVRWLALIASALFVTLPAAMLDSMLGSRRLPLGYLAVAERCAAPKEAEGVADSGLWPDSGPGAR